MLKITTLLYGVAMGVQEMTLAGFVWADGKPDNVLIGADGKVKVSREGESGNGSWMGRGRGGMGARGWVDINQEVGSSQVCS